MASLFDDYGDSYGETVERAIRFSGLRHDFFLKAKSNLLRRLVIERRLGQDGTGVRALDVGCGIGSLHRHLKGAFSTLDGCDVSAEGILRARQDNPSVAYSVCTCTRLPYEDRAFDLVFVSCVLHHVAPDDWRDFLGEMRRVLRRGGIACVIEHNPWNPMTRLAVLRCPFDKDAVLLRAAKVEALLRETGFTEVRSEHFLLLPQAGGLAGKIERALATLPLGAQYACSARA
jgi:ubiquinone/menaquinone biosynthesis C-methylase UbiE